MFFLVLFLVLCSLQLSVAEMPPSSPSVVCLYSRFEGSFTSNLQQCSECSDKYYSLEDVVRNDTQVYVCSTPYVLGSKVTFENVANFSLIGAQPNTVIECSNSEEVALEFVGLENLEIRRLTFDGCGALFDSTTADITDNAINNVTVPVSATLYIINSTNINLSEVSVVNGNGNGALIFDTNGTIRISNSLFHNNTARNAADSPYQNLSGGGGLYIEFTYCTPGVYGECDQSNQKNKNSRYFISDCRFVNNVATVVDPEGTNFIRGQGTDNQGLGRGGGLMVLFKGEAENNTVGIHNCTFLRNSAIWGGGFYGGYQDSTANNTLTVTSGTTFRQNSCTKGGGAVDIGYQFFDSGTKPPMENCIHFKDVVFELNSATAGGGLAFFSSQGNMTDLRNKIKFANCTWTDNRARFGSAVDVARTKWSTLTSNGYLPVPVFDSNRFIDNKVVGVEKPAYISGTYSQYRRGDGAFTVTGFPIQFLGELNFTRNNGSAMYITSSDLTFASGSRVLFEENQGFQGGAMALIAFTTLIVSDNSSFRFINNTSINRGGAIYYHSVDLHDYVASRSCFIQYSGGSEPVSKRNIQFIFESNTAGNLITQYQYGSSIYATSLKPCYQSCVRDITRERNMSEVFSCIGDFHFNNHTREIASSGARFIVNMSGRPYIGVIPGKEHELKMYMTDDLFAKVPATYYVSVENASNTSVRIDSSYLYVSSSIVKLYGTPGDKAVLTLSKLGFRGMELSLPIELQQCPPGFVVFTNRVKNLSECVCSAGRDSTYHYSGIDRCDNILYHAYLTKGHWLGYDSNDESHTNLVSAYCPTGYCFTNQPRELSYRLPSDSSKENLDHLVCDDTRTGTLCGECRENHSAQYHSSTFECGGSDKCNIGWLLYVVSELVPLTLLFLVIIIFDISFTSGTLNGFIFFAQVFDSLCATGKNFILFPDGVYTIYKINRMVYKLFNFDFFVIKNLSFCLWQGATTMDVLTFKFVTVIYALLLVTGIIWFMSVCNVYQKIPCLKSRSTKSSVVHGLSAFLIMVYAQCAKVSFLILTYSYVYSNGFHVKQKVVHQQGNIKFFSPEHLPYAIPALVCICTLVILPPILLIVYPLCFRVLSILRLDKYKCTGVVIQKFPYAKLVPFLDSFQGCYKDNLRFFSGLYFFYRALLLAWWFLPRMTQSYIIIELQLVTILLLHALAQPYKKRCHNIIDALVVFNLAIINGITLHNYIFAWLGQGSRFHDLIYVMSTIQVVFISLPLVCLLIYIALVLFRILKVRKLFRYCTAKRKWTSVDETPLGPLSMEGELPALRLQSDYHDSFRFKTSTCIDYLPLVNEQHATT